MSCTLFTMFHIIPKSTKNCFLQYREALLAEMGVAIREDGGTLGVFSPKKVEHTEMSMSSDFPLSGDVHTLPLSHLCFCFFFFHENPCCTITGFSHLFTLLFCLSTLCYLLLSHKQLSHEITFQEHFDHYPTKKVCLIEVVGLSFTRCNPSSKISDVLWYNMLNVPLSMSLTWLPHSLHSSLQYIVCT